MLNLNDKTITIIGSQKSGMAIAKLVKKLGGLPKISDANDAQSLSTESIEWVREQQVPLELSQHTKKFIIDSDLVVLSPGVRFDSDPVKWAQEAGIGVLGEIEFGFQFCSKPIVAVTGSNGKTTVVNLIKEITNKSGLRALLCGNVGQPFCEHVLNSDDCDYVILEVSSFQMESLVKENQSASFCCKGFKPYIAVLLNFSENHLDRHKDLDEYWKAKVRIFENQTADDFAVLNFLDDQSKCLEGQLASKIYFFNKDEDLSNPNHSAVTTVASILKIDQKICMQVFNEFKGVEHRLEWVRNIDGVNYINDSKATTAEAGRWALEHLENPILLICGGKDKNIDLSVLSDVVQEKVKRMFVFGEAKEKIEQTFSGLLDIDSCQSLDDAIQKSKNLAAEGDCILLSPMCASFDMFANFEERGRTFKDIVNKL